MALPQGLLVGIDVLGVVLLHFFWQGAIVGLAYAGLKPACSSAAARYRLGLCALAALALAPGLTAYACWPDDSMSAAADSATIWASTLQAGAQATAWRLQPLLPWLVGIWLFGVVAIAARSFWQWHRLMRLVQSADPAPAQWQARLHHLCERFGLRRPVRLLCSAAAATPMLLGWLRPGVLLPASMLSGFTPVQIEMIIAHELGHIRRFDYLVNLLQVAIETILFYHPVVHWISRDVRNARETCCDDLALQFAGGSRLAYARALAGLEELRLTPALGAGGGALLARIKRIVGEAETAEPLPRNYLLPFVLVLALAAVTWRVQHATPESSAAISRISAQALALISGTTFHIERPALSIAVPPPAIRPTMQRSAVELMAAPVPELVGRSAAPAATAVVEQTAAPAPADPIAQAPAPAAAMPVPAPAAPLPAHSAEPLAAASPNIAPLRVVAPVYPAQAMIAGIEGAVELEYRIGANGSVGQIRVIRARPAGIFDEAAKTALRGWQFPAQGGGELQRQNFAFTLHGQSKAEEQCQAPTGSLICRKPGA